MVVGRRTTLQVAREQHSGLLTCTNTSKQDKFREILKMSDFPEVPNLTHTTGSCLNYIRREGEGERWIEGQARTTKWYSSVAE